MMRGSFELGHPVSLPPNP